MIRDALIRARARLSQRECWTQRAEARNTEGRGVKATDQSAVCWCAQGALLREAESLKEYALACRVMSEALKMLTNGFGDIPRYNDEAWREHDEILEVFDAAIKGYSLDH